MALNEVDKLLKLIANRLGTKAWKLPKEIDVPTWMDEVIEPETLETFSCYLPHMVRINVSTKKKKDGYCLIDQELFNGERILGVRDVAFDQFGQDSLYIQQAAGLGVYDYMSTASSLSMDDVGLLQMRADLVSIFNNQIYLDFKEPNMVKITSVTGADVSNSLAEMPIDVFIKHPSNLMTIPATQMPLFKNMATADVANYILAYVNQFNDIETVFGTADVKLNTIEQWAGKKEDFENELKAGYVNPANKNQPIIYTV